MICTCIQYLLQLVNNDKYYHDLFYIGPIYHKKFLKLKRLDDVTLIFEMCEYLLLHRVIFVDVDLVFHADIKDLEVKIKQSHIYIYGCWDQD